VNFKRLISGSIAHVGYDGSAEDQIRSIIALEWVAANKWHIGSFTLDYINLHKGRDFLKEDKQHAMVILHFLFRGGFGIAPDGGGNPQLQHSTEQSWSAWVKRLAATKARLIFAFGGFAEVGGSFLARIEGYQRIEVDSNFSVFVREDLT
jgi:hypothetical protein